MALASSVYWEVRTTGSATNGGGFDSVYSGTGTDYSQQDVCQASATDFACVDTSLSLTSVTVNFTSAMVGNLIYISAGTNVVTGWYEIQNYHNITTVGIDRTCATAGNNAILSTGFIGGAVNHPNTISDSLTALNIVYIQNGTYVKVGANTYILSASIDSITWLGYNSATGRTVSPTGANRPVFDGDSDSSGTGDTANCIIVATGMDNNLFKNLILKNATASAFSNPINASEAVLFNCRLTLSVDGFGGGEDCHFFYCEIDTNSDSGTDSGPNADHSLNYLYVHDNTNEGLNWTPNTSTVNSRYSIYESNGGHGLAAQGTGYITNLIGNVAYNNTGASSDGFLWADGSAFSYNFSLFNNSAIDNGRYGINRASTSDNYPSMFLDYNNYNGNGTAGLNNLTAGANDTTAAPAFTDAPGGDFTLTSADTALLEKGFFNTAYNGLVGDYKWNIGVAQGGAATGSGTTASVAWYPGE